MLNNHCFTFTKDLHKQAIEAIECLGYNRDMTFVKPTVPKPINDLKNWLNEPQIKEFIKQRRIFTNTEQLIDNLREYSLDDLQHSFDKISEKLKSGQPQSDNQTINTNVMTNLNPCDMDSLASVFKKSSMGNLFREFALQYAVNNKFDLLIDVTSDTLLGCISKDISIDYQESYNKADKLIDLILNGLDKGVKNESNMYQEL